MRICVLGAGVTGLMSAWALARDGHDVTIVDQLPVAGAGASQSNGAQLSFAFVAPLASRALLRSLPRLLLAKDPAVRFAPGLDRDGFNGAAQFIRAISVFSRSQQALTALAALSRREFDVFDTAENLDYGRRTCGKLVLYRSAKAWDAARFAAEIGATKQDETLCLSSDECRPLVPHATDHFAGGIYMPDEQVADCHAFCTTLAQRLQANGVNVILDAGSVAPVFAGGCLAAVGTPHLRIEADLFVLCFGAGSASFAGACGFRLPIYPLQGHSVTLNEQSEFQPLTVSVTDAERRMVFAPLQHGGTRRIRVAGFADFVGRKLRFDPKRIDSLTAAAANLIGSKLVTPNETWVGARPMTPDSCPFIGPAPVPNLVLNTGHGMFGWTLAAGSARLLADSIAGRASSLANAFAYVRPMT
jgi:D-amino-acid dehydrogenase